MAGSSESQKTGKDGVKVKIIRFRAWNKVKKEMITDVINNCVDNFDMVLKHPQIYDVMQYTGLKDKNGVEIYEGDVVSASWYDYEEPRCDAIGQIIFNENWCSYCIWDEENKKMSELNGQGAYYWEIEVIGNIYDNPELLESLNV